LSGCASKSEQCFIFQKDLEEAVINPIEEFNSERGNFSISRPTFWTPYESVVELPILYQVTLADSSSDLTSDGKFIRTAQIDFHTYIGTYDSLETEHVYDRELFIKDFPDVKIRCEGELIISGVQAKYIHYNDKIECCCEQNSVISFFFKIPNQKKQFGVLTLSVCTIYDSEVELFRMKEIFESFKINY
jgi:hypothetical protein